MMSKAYIRFVKMIVRVYENISDELIVSKMTRQIAEESNVQRQTVRYREIESEIRQVVKG
ncbi:MULTISPECIES: hypothetical protein [unclassified Psychrobacillus]|uniref:hypothetical protein n=1 Tax=unclassified Psychrobacillus TaxID=2636677 RepID=UPI0030F4B57C